jgi:hypothetical protein
VGILFRALLLFGVCGEGWAQLPDQEPISGAGRAKWAINSTVGPASLAGGVVSAAWGTMLNQPNEYGTHWDGFGKRYGMRLTGIATSNAMEAGMGALWGEDPRYHRTEGQPFKNRVGHVIKMTFLAEARSGEAARPAYARYAAYAGNNFVSNTWRPDSEADGRHAVARIGLGFLGRMANNAFVEFWPDVRGRAFRKHPR